MSEETILDGNTSATSDKVIEALVGEGKTYKTVEDLAKGKLNADIHIQRIELENKELRDKVASAKTVEDLLEKINAKTTPNDDTGGSGGTQGQASAGLSVDQIAKLVDEQLQGREVAGVKAANKARAEAELKKLFGDKAKEVFEKEATSSEKRAALLQLAEADPSTFVGIFNKEQPKSGSLDNGQNGRNLNVNLSDNQGLIPGTQKYYSELRRKQPQLYYSDTIQLEMHQAALKDPNKYFNT